jgi:hypothetical protein
MLAVNILRVIMVFPPESHKALRFSKGARMRCAEGHYRQLKGHVNIWGENLYKAAMEWFRHSKPLS